MTQFVWQPGVSTLEQKDLCGMTGISTDGASDRLVVRGIGAAALFYGLLLLAGWPQEATESIVEAAAHDAAQAASHTATELGPVADASIPHGPSVHSPLGPPLWTVIPFVLLLGAIAVLPLMRWTEHWWESNLHRFYVALGLGVITLAYYALGHDSPLEGHWPAHHVVEPTASTIQLGFAWTVLANAILQEYIPFIVLLFSLYTITGGIRIEGDLQATPRTNAAFITAGGILASFIGTTGAAMVLIRPLLETNRERRLVQHTVVFFIFVVCNCGGCLLPIGDPPLFLGYLRDVPFLWTLSLWPQWLLVNGLLIATYLLLDRLVFYPRETQADLKQDAERVRGLRFHGALFQGTLLLAVVAAVAFLAPSRTFPGTDWHPWLYLREVVQLALVGLSLSAGSDQIRQRNQFNYNAIVEVAALFFGIFLCMQPALAILNVSGPRLGIDTASEFFWVTGGLSSVLDNAPTYVVFFETAKTVSGNASQTVAGVDPKLLSAVALGAVFMGAMTYIGNGPNFMVKAIAEKSGVRMPSFFGYILCYSVPVLLPIFLLKSYFYFY